MNAHRRSARRRNVSAAGAAVSVVGLAWAFACGGGSVESPPAPADVSGNYTLAITNGTNGCQFSNWTSGSSTQGVHLTLDQSGADAGATVTGLVGALFDVILGGMPHFEGTVSGTSFTLTAVGTNSATDGQCSFTIKATMTGTETGDAIQGQISYGETTNGSADCGFHATCASVQSYAGVRTPDAGGGD
jgi:hypothetical protein